MKKNNKGFSLVELIVVMAIMAILVGAIAPQVVKYVDKSRETKDLQVANTVFTAFQTEIASSTYVDTTIAPMTISSLSSTTSLIPLYNKAMILMSDDLNTATKIEGKLASKNGKAGDIVIEYSGGKLKVGIGSVSGGVATYTIGPVTN